MGIGVAADATLNTEQLISHTRVTLVDTISSLQDPERGVISVSEVHELLTKIHEILDSAMSKWVGNTTSILAHVFNSASRQHHELLASQFPFLHSVIGTVLLLRLAFVATKTGLWHRLSTSFSWGYLSLFLLCEVVKSDWFPFQCAKETCAGVSWCFFGKEASFGE